MRYESRTALLPFVFVFNPEILMIDSGGVVHFLLVVGCAVLAMSTFVAASQNWLLTRNMRSVLVPADRPSRYWFTIPALGLLAVIVLLQRRRQTSQPAPAAD
jgi:TRAP-type uncharacterized transport system fused permease subunit